ncbi:MAG: hypothetical protein NUV84_02700 [Candidatus Uhrbacteria bacterium]|nr:hypothetical protein [Candidatus Uhrbacteria bacterium]
MSKAKTLAALRKYSQATRRSRFRKRYLDAFVPLMIYRTTKTENSELSRNTVDKLLSGK